MKSASIRRLLCLSAATYGVGQLANFGFQLLLLQRLGTELYGQVGLAHLLLISLIFLADMGYSTLFLRDPPHGEGWQHRWRQALAQRMLATLILLPLVVAGWWMWSDQQSGLDYLLSGAPGCLLALFNFSSPMIAQGRRLTGLLISQVTWPSALLAWALLPDTLPLSAAGHAGLAFSLGYLAQAIGSVLISGQPRLWLPTPGKEQLGSALYMSLMGASGTLHERLTPFLLATMAPAFLPWFLLLNHVVSGLSGVQAQLSRLLLADAASEKGRINTLTIASIMLWGTAIGLLAGLQLQHLGLSSEQRTWLALSAIFVLTWGLSATCGILNCLLISARKERPLAWLIIATQGCSTLLQLMATTGGETRDLLGAKLLGSLVLLGGSLYLIKGMPTRGGLIALGSALLACAAANAPSAQPATTLLLIPVLGAWLHTVSCFRQIPDNGMQR